MRIFQLMKIEIAENDSEKRVDTLVEFAEIFNLASENKESKLRVGKKNDQKHDHEASDILCRARESFREL